MPKNTLTLSHINRMIRETLDSGLDPGYWITAEILELHINRNGHCYLELVEKSETNDSVIARSRATIWSSKFRMLRPYFENATSMELKPGIKILFRASVAFHAVYGLSLNITDIDPSYTVGDMALKKRMIIQKLEKSGMMNMNRELEMPTVPQHIAIISSETAAGFGDFMQTLSRNPYGYVFHTTLFPAVMQGQAAEKSITGAMETIFSDKRSFDAAILIRGGGSQADLDCFNSYEIAMHIAQFPIPVLTGIGHERDETIADLVAHTRLKTPTAVAEFLVGRLLEFESGLQELGERLRQMTDYIIREQKNRLQQHRKDIFHLSNNYLLREKRSVEQFREQTARDSRRFLEQRKERLAASSGQLKYQWKASVGQHRRELEQDQQKLKKYTLDLLRSIHTGLEQREKHLELLRPERVLARGFSITYADGKSVRDASSIKPGCRITTTLARGYLESRVENTGRGKPRTGEGDSDDEPKKKNI